MASQDLLNTVGESETESTVDVSNANAGILSDSDQDTGAAAAVQLGRQTLLAFEDDTFPPFAANPWVSNPSQDQGPLGESPGGHLSDLLNLDLDSSVPLKNSVLDEDQSVVSNIFDQNILVNDYHEDQKKPVLAAATNLQLGDESSADLLGLFKSMEDVGTDNTNSANIDLWGGFAAADSGSQTQDIVGGLSNQPSIPTEGNATSGVLFDDFSMLFPESDWSGNLVSNSVKGSMSILTNEPENNQMTEAEDGIARSLDCLEPANFESMATPSSGQHDQTPSSRQIGQMISDQNILDIFDDSENKNNETLLTINAQQTDRTDMKVTDSFSLIPSLHGTGDVPSNSIIFEDVRDPGGTTNAAAKHDDLLGTQGSFEDDDMASIGPEEHSESSKTDLFFLLEQPSFSQLQPELPKDKSIPESDDSKEGSTKCSQTDKRSDFELLASATESIPIISSDKLTDARGILDLPENLDCFEETKSATIQKPPRMDSRNHNVLGQGKSNATQLGDKECLHEENSRHLDLISPETNDQKSDSDPNSDQKQTSEILLAEENVSFDVDTLGVYGLEQDSEDFLKEVQTVIQKFPGGPSTSPIFENKEESSTPPMRNSESSKREFDFKLDGDMDVFHFSGQKMNATSDFEQNVCEEPSQIINIVPATENDEDPTGPIDISSTNESMGVIVNETESNVDEDSENDSGTSTASAFLNANVLLDQISEIQVDAEAKPNSACYSQASLSALEEVDPFRVTTTSDSLEFLEKPSTFSDQLSSDNFSSREMAKAPPKEIFLDASGQTESRVHAEGPIILEEKPNIVQSTLKENDSSFDFHEEHETSSGMTDITATDGNQHEHAEQEYEGQPSEWNKNDLLQQPTSSTAARGIGQTLVQSESGSLQDPVDSQSERLLNEPHLELKPGKCDPQATNVDDVQQQVVQKLQEPDEIKWEGSLQTDVISNGTRSEKKERVEDLSELLTPESADNTVCGSHQTFQTVLSELLQSVYKSAAEELNLYDGEGDLQVCEVEMKTKTGTSSDIIDEKLQQIGTEKEDSPSSEEENVSDTVNEVETQMDMSINVGFISNVTEIKPTATQPQLNLLDQSSFENSSTLPKSVKLNTPDSSDLNQVIDSIVPLNWSLHTSSGAPLVHEDTLVTTNVTKQDKHSDDCDRVILLRAPNDSAASDSTSIVADKLSKSSKADAGIVDRDLTLGNLPQESYDSDQPATSDNNKTDSAYLMMPRGKELEESSTLQMFDVLITPAGKVNFPAQSNFESKLDGASRNVAKTLSNNDPTKCTLANAVSVLEQETLLKSAEFDLNQTMNPSVGNGVTTNHDTSEKDGSGIETATNQADDLLATVDGNQTDQKFEHYDQLKLQYGIYDDDDFELISDSEVLSPTETDTGTLEILVSQLAKEASVDEQDLSSTDEQRSDETKQFEAFSSDQIDMNSEVKDQALCKESGIERISEANSLSEATLRKHGDTQDLEQVSHPETDVVNTVVSETSLSNDEDTDRKPIPLPDEVVPTSMLLEEFFTSEKFLETESDRSSNTSLIDSLDDGFDVNNNVAAMADDATVSNLIRELVDNIIFESISAKRSSEEVKAADEGFTGDKFYVGIVEDVDDQGVNASTKNDDSFRGIVSQGIAQVVPKDGKISNGKGEAVPDCISIAQHDPGATPQQSQDEVNGFSAETDQHVEKLSCPQHHATDDGALPTKQSSPPMIPMRKKKKQAMHLGSKMEPAPCRSPLHHKAEITEDDPNGTVEIPDCAHTIVSSTEVEIVLKTDGSALLLHDATDKLSLQLDDFENSAVDQGNLSSYAEEEHEITHNALSNDYISNYEPVSSDPINNLYPDVTKENIKPEDDCSSPLSGPEQRDDDQGLVAVQCASHGVLVEVCNHTMFKEDQVLQSLLTDNMHETPVSMLMDESHSESSTTKHAGSPQDCSGLSEDVINEKDTSGSSLLNFSTLHDESVETTLELSRSNVSEEKPDIFSIPGLSDANQSTGTHAPDDINEDGETLKSQLVNQARYTANRSGFSSDTLSTEDNVPLLTGNQNTGSDNKSDVPLKIHPDIIQDLKGSVVNSFINNDKAAANIGSVDGHNYSQVPKPSASDDTESRNLKIQTASILDMSEQEDSDEVGKISEAFEVNETLADADSEFANVGEDDLVPEQFGYDDAEVKGSHSQQDFDHNELNNCDTGTESFEKNSLDPFYVQSSAVMDYDDDELYPNTSSFEVQKSSIASGVIKKVLTPHAQTYAATSSHYIPITGFSSAVPSSVFIDKDLISDNEDDEGSNRENVASSSEDEKEDSAIEDGTFADENEYDDEFLQSFPGVTARVFPVVTSPYDQSSQYDQSGPDAPNYTYQAYDVDWEELLMQAPPRFPNLPVIMEESEPSDTEESKRKYPMIPMNYDPSEDHSKDDDDISLKDVQYDQEHYGDEPQENGDSCITPTISDTSVKDKYLEEHVTDVHPIPDIIVSPEANDCGDADYSSSTENAEAVSTLTKETDLNEHSVDSPLLEALSGNIAQNVVVEAFVSASKEQEEQSDSSLNSDESEEHIYLVSKGNEMEATASAINSDDEDQIFAASVIMSDTNVLVDAKTEITIEEMSEVYVKNVENRDENDSQTMLEGSVDALEPANNQLLNEDLPSRDIVEQCGAAENVFEASDADSSSADLSSNASANRPFEKMVVETAVEEAQNEIPISEDQVNSNTSDLPISSSIDVDQQKEGAAVLLPLKNSLELAFDVSNPNDGISPNELNPQVSKSEDIGQISIAETVLTVPPPPPKRRKPKLKKFEDTDVANPLTEEDDVAAPPPPPVRKKKKTLNVQNDVEPISASHESQIRPRVPVDGSELEHRRVGQIQSVIVQDASRNKMVQSSDSFEMPTSTTSFQESLTENFSSFETTDVPIISSDIDPGSVSSAALTPTSQVKYSTESPEVILPVLLQVDKTNEPIDKDRLVGKTDAPNLMKHLAVRPEIDTESSSDNYADKELELIHTIAKPDKLLLDDSFQNDDQTPNSTSPIPTVNQSKTEILLAETSPGASPHMATSPQTESDDPALKVEQPSIDSNTPDTAQIVEGLGIVMIANGNIIDELEVIDKETADSSTSEGPLSDDSIQESSDEDDMTDRVKHTYNIMAREVIDHLLIEVIKLVEDQNLKEEKLGITTICQELVSDILTEVCCNLKEKKILSKYDSETTICDVDTGDILTVDESAMQSKEKAIVPLSITSGNEEIPEVSETPIVVNQVNDDIMEMLETPQTMYQIPLTDQNDDYDGSEGIPEVSEGFIVADQFDNDTIKMLETPQTLHQIPLQDENDDYKSPVEDVSDGLPEMSEGPIVADQFDNHGTEMLVTPQTSYQIPFGDENDDYRSRKTRRKRYDTTGSIGSIRYLTDSEEDEDESLQPAIQSQRPETLISLVDDAVVDDDTPSPTSLKTPELEFSALDDDHPHPRKSLIPPSSLVLSVALDDIDLTEKQNNQSDIAETPLLARLSFSSSVMGSQTSLASSTEDGSGSKRGKLPSLPTLRPRKPSEPTEPVIVRTKLELLAQEDIIPIVAKPESRRFVKWETVSIKNIEYRIDETAIQPYKKVVAHGGFYSEKSAIIEIFTSYLPPSNTEHYAWVMDNLFLYVLATVELLALEKFSVVLFVGSTPKNQIPANSLLKKWHEHVDYRLKKNVEAFYIVSPTFYFRTMARLFVSRKVMKKMKYVKNMAELKKFIPTEFLFVPPEIAK